MDTRKRKMIFYILAVMLVAFWFQSAFGYQINLNKEQNLISLPEQPANTAIAQVTSSIAGKFNSIWAYMDGSWRLHDPGDPNFSDLLTMEAGRGYWIDMKEGGTLSGSGTAAPSSIPLSKGLNLIGFNTTVPAPVTDALKSINGKYDALWAFKDGVWKLYDPKNPNFSDLTTMEPGVGYWIDALESCTLDFSGLNRTTGELKLDPPGAEGSISGTYTTYGEGRPVRFSATPGGEGKAQAHYQMEGSTKELTIQINAPDQGEIRWGGLAIDGYGALSSQEEAALQDLAGSELKNALVMTPLEIACQADNLSPAAAAALLMPWQMIIKYLTPNRLEAVRSFANRSSCNYFPDLMSAPISNTPKSWAFLLSYETPVPVVFGHFPFDTEGAVEKQNLAPQGFTESPYGPCNAKCRGACGADCSPINCKDKQKKEECLVDEATNKNTGKKQVWLSQTCWSHEGCRWHDACFDDCNKRWGCGSWLAAGCRHLVWNACDKLADQKYGAINCIRWAQGYEGIEENGFDSFDIYRYKEGEPISDSVLCPVGIEPVVVTISPEKASLFTGETKTFTATVTGTNSTAVNWIVKEGPAGGTITSDGVYTAPKNANDEVNRDFYHVIATSKADPTKTDTAVISVSKRQPFVGFTVNVDINKDGSGCPEWNKSAQGLRIGMGGINCPLVWHGGYFAANCELKEWWEDSKFTIKTSIRGSVDANFKKVIEIVGTQESHRETTFWIGDDVTGISTSDLTYELTFFNVPHCVKGSGIGEGTDVFCLEGVDISSHVGTISHTESWTVSLFPEQNYSCSVISINWGKLKYDDGTLADSIKVTFAPYPP